MRTLMLSAIALVSTITAAGQAQAHEGCRGIGARLSMELTQLEQLNYRRPRDVSFSSIEHTIDMVRARIGDLSDERRSPQQALSMLQDGLYNIAQYNNNGRQDAPYVAAQIDMVVSRMGQQVREAQRELAGYPGRRPQNYMPTNYGGAAYGQAPAVATYGQTPLYVPPPAPAQPYYRY